MMIHDSPFVLKSHNFRPCWSSSDSGVDLLIKTFRNTMIAFVWCIMKLTHGWWVSIQSIVGTVSARSCSVSSLMWY